MSASRAEKSDGSSAGAASFCDADCDLLSSRAALPPFFRREEVVENARRERIGHCLGCCWVVVVEACLGELLEGSDQHDKHKEKCMCT